jgi:hypothetical protein
MSLITAAAKARRNVQNRRITMNASKLFTAVAAVVVAGSAFATEAPVASAAVASSAVTSVAITAPAPAGYAERNLNVPSLHVNKFDTQQRARVRTQAIDAVKTGRTTFQTQLDFLKG